MLTGPLEGLIERKPHRKAKVLQAYQLLNAHGSPKGLFAGEPDDLDATASELPAFEQTSPFYEHEDPRRTFTNHLRTQAVVNKTNECLLVEVRPFTVVTPVFKTWMPQCGTAELKRQGRLYTVLYHPSPQSSPPSYKKQAPGTHMNATPFKPHLPPTS